MTDTYEELLKHKDYLITYKIKYRDGVETIQEQHFCIPEKLSQSIDKRKEYLKNNWRYPDVTDIIVLQVIPLF